MPKSLLLAALLLAAGCGAAAHAHAPAARPRAAHAAADMHYGAYLPRGPERAALQADCEICHSGDMYATQRLSKATWDAEVTKMMKFGSPLPKPEKSRVVDYLARYLGPTVPRVDAVPTATAPPISYTAPPQSQ
jgi:hypothetical protein